MWFLFFEELKLMRFIMSLGKASWMLYTESPFLLPKGSKICLNPLRFTVFRETKWRLGHEACSVMQLRSDFHPWREKRLAVFPRDMSQADCTNSTARFRILWLGQLCSVLPPVSQKQSHAPHTPQPPESRWVWKDTVGEGYDGNRGSSHLWPGSLDEGARNVGSIRISHLW